MKGVSSQGGFTLIELMVTISIIGMMSMIIVVAYPTTRDNQELQAAKQQVQVFLSEALQMAMNDVQNDNCLSKVSEDQRGRCSDIGIYFSGNKITMFADTNDDHKYSTADPADSEIKSITLGGISYVSGSSSYLFEGVPPTVNMTVNGTDSKGSVILSAGSHSAKLEILPFGKVQLTNKL